MAGLRNKSVGSVEPLAYLGREFYARHHLDVARDLVGATLTWGGCSGRIVEVEAYAAENDPACHTAHRPSSREFFVNNPPGTAYVYLNYGIHWLLNVLAGDGIILFRALEPADGLDLMKKRRGRQYAEELCSGPGKIGSALALGPADHGRSFVGDPCRGILPATNPVLIERTPRIGISKAIERDWRFCHKDHPCLSRKSALRPPLPP